MIVRIPAVLSPADLRQCRDGLAKAEWIDGRATAGQQSALGKQNQQLAEDAAPACQLGKMILARRGESAKFISAALPARVFPPLFNRYGVGMGFDAHIDNAIRYAATTGAHYRTDVSCTLFLSDPADYDGGELLIEGGVTPVKFSAGDLALYPATTVHRVQPVTRGVRLAAFFWVQSMVREHERRDLLHGMDEAIALARRDLGDAHAAAISLTGAYHNLIRMWAEV